ncbi:unnamed protein product [Rotaria magnacalcarata]
MSRNGTYADYLAVSAAAVIVNKNILIHELGKKPLFIPGSYYIDDQLHICYYPDKLHYNSVVDAIGNTAILPSEAIVFTWPILFLLITIIFLFNHYYYYYYYYLTILSFFEHSFFNTYNTNLLKFIIILFFLFLSIYYLMSKFSIYQTSSQTSLLYVIIVFHLFIKKRFLIVIIICDKRIMRIFLKNEHDQPINIAKVHGKFPSNAIEINTNLDDLNETMNIDLTDILTVSTIIDDVGDVTEEKSCSICRQNMIPLISKPNLIKCVNCKKIMVINKDNMQISMAFEIGDGNKLTFWTMKGLLKNFIQQQRPDERMNNEDISEILLLQGPWKMTLSVFRRQVLALTKD